MYRIRAAGPDDVPALARLAQETFIETFVEGFEIAYPADDLQAFLTRSYALDQVEGWMADATSLLLVAEQAGELIGYVQAGDNDLPYIHAAAGDGEVKRIYVRKAFQGIGLGRDLLERALGWLGARPVLLGVWSENLKAQRFYARYGFETVGEYHFMVGSFADPEFIMRRG
jgi:ribosomal protein S18 acetylase RimI-like enzyme